MHCTTVNDTQPSHRRSCAHRPAPNGCRPKAKGDAALSPSGCPRRRNAACDLAQGNSTCTRSYILLAVTQCCRQKGHSRRNQRGESPAPPLVLRPPAPSPIHGHARPVRQRDAPHEDHSLLLLLDGSASRARSHATRPAAGHQQQERPADCRGEHVRPSLTASSPGPTDSVSGTDSTTSLVTTR